MHRSYKDYINDDRLSQLDILLPDFEYLFCSRNGHTTYDINIGRDSAAAAVEQCVPASHGEAGGGWGDVSGGVCVAGGGVMGARRSFRRLV